MRVILFGRSWVGRHLLGNLVDAGFKVHMVASDDANERQNLRGSGDEDTVVIHTGGMIGGTQGSEDDVKLSLQKLYAEPLELWGECARQGVPYVGLSSGCVFFGAKNTCSARKTNEEVEKTDFWDEEDHGDWNFSDDCPQNAQHKAAMEAGIEQLFYPGRETPTRIVRFRLPFGDSPHEKCFASKLRVFEELSFGAQSFTSLKLLGEAIVMICQHLFSLHPIKKGKCSLRFMNIVGRDYIDSRGLAAAIETYYNRKVNVIPPNPKRSHALMKPSPLVFMCKENETYPELVRCMRAQKSYQIDPKEPK